MASGITRQIIWVLQHKDEGQTTFSTGLTKTAETNNSEPVTLKCITDT